MLVVDITTGVTHWDNAMGDHSFISYGEMALDMKRSR